ncbi:MAG: hypothetical protein NTW18_02340 [Candidatus Omnitrophica bacterium]|nr:hypothetical protein [Candidatus Omnitrophota bacterium]
MKVKLRKILSLALTISLLFQQIGFAQIATELNLVNHFARMASSLTVEKFRPLHLRYFSYDNLNDNFKVLVDKGDFEKGLSPKGAVPEEKLKEETKTLLSYFLVGVTLPDSMFWVNLRPDSEDQIIDQYLEKTDIGKIMLEADLQLKKDTALMTSPATPEGREYWDRLYKKAAELYGYDNVSIPTLTRPWIVPGEIIVRESQDSAYVYKANLKVMLEQDYLKDSSNYNFKDSRSKALNEYSSELIRELIIPKLTKEVNSSKRYAPLRQVYYSLILARWFKLRFSGKTGTYASLINTRNLTNLISKDSWSKTDYFKQYQKSFSEGEYNIQEPVRTPTGQVIRSYFSGGIDVASSAINTQNGVSNLKAALPLSLFSRTGVIIGGNAARPFSVNLQPVVAASVGAASPVKTSSPIFTLDDRNGVVFSVYPRTEIREDQLREAAEVLKNRIFNYPKNGKIIDIQLVPGSKRQIAYPTRWKIVIEHKPDLEETLVTLVNDQGKVIINIGYSIDSKALDLPEKLLNEHLQMALISAASRIRFNSLAAASPVSSLENQAYLLALTLGIKDSERKYVAVVFMMPLIKAFMDNSNPPPTSSQAKEFYQRIINNTDKTVSVEVLARSFAFLSNPNASLSEKEKFNSSPVTSNLAKAVEEAQSQLPADVNEQILKFIVTGDENGRILYPIWPQDSVMVGHVRDDRAGYFARGLQNRGFKNLLGYIKFTNDFQGKAVLSEETIASVPNTFFERISNKGYQVLVISEDEKKSHTGKNAAGRKKDGLFPGQKQIVIPMQKSEMAYVDTPQMKMKECADEVLNGLDDDATDFILVNLLSSDMMKHTGNFQAAKKSNEITDQQIGRIKEKVDRIKSHILGDMMKEVNKYLSREEASQLYVLLLNNYAEFLARLKNKNQELYKRIKDLEAKIPIFVITADHGASEAGLTDNPKESDTFHTANPVPYIIYDPLRTQKLALKSGQTIRNNGATLLHLLGEEIPQGSDPSLLPDDYQGSKRRITMAVLDGWGINPDQNYPWDAIRLANTPNYDWMVENASFTQVQAHGEVIGLRGPLSLEEGRHHLRGLQAGQTDVGHLHLFSLREIKQPLWYVDRLIKGSIRDGVFDESKPEVQVLVKELQRVKDNNLRFHYITIASEGGVHSSLYHMYALMRLAKKIGLRQDQFIIHFAADGRDVPTRTAHLYIQDVEKRIEEIGIGVIATVFGRDMFVRKDGAENITNRIIDVMEGINLDAQDVTQVKSVASSAVTAVESLRNDILTRLKERIKDDSVVNLVRSNYLFYTANTPSKLAKALVQIEENLDGLIMSATEERSRDLQTLQESIESELAKLVSVDLPVETISEFAKIVEKLAGYGDVSFDISGTGTLRIRYAGNLSMVDKVEADKLLVKARKLIVEVSSIIGKKISQSYVMKFPQGTLAAKIREDLLLEKARISESFASSEVTYIDINEVRPPDKSFTFQPTNGVRIFINNRVNWYTLQLARYEPGKKNYLIFKIGNQPVHYAYLSSNLTIGQQDVVRTIMRKIENGTQLWTEIDLIQALEKALSMSQYKPKTQELPSPIIIEPIVDNKIKVESGDSERASSPVQKEERSNYLFSGLQEATLDAIGDIQGLASWAPLIEEGPSGVELGMDIIMKEYGLDSDKPILTQRLAEPGNFKELLEKIDKLYEFLEKKLESFSKLLADVKEQQKKIMTQHISSVSDQGKGIEKSSVYWGSEFVLEVAINNIEIAMLKLRQAVEKVKGDIAIVPNSYIGTKLKEGASSAVTREKKESVNLLGGSTQKRVLRVYEEKGRDLIATALATGLTLDIVSEYVKDAKRNPASSAVTEKIKETFRQGGLSLSEYTMDYIAKRLSSILKDGDDIDRDTAAKILISVYDNNKLAGGTRALGQVFATLNDARELREMVKYIRDQKDKSVASSAVHHKIINLYDFDSIKAKKIDPSILKNRFIEKIEELIADVREGKRREFAGELIRLAKADENLYTIWFTDTTWVDIRPQGTEIDINFRCRAGIEQSVVWDVRRLIKLSQSELLVGTVGSAVQTPEETASSALTPGGIDFRALPMSIQPMGSFAGLNFKLPQLTQAQLKQINIESEMQQVKNLVESGIVPSGDRIKELIAACSQKGKISYYVDNLLLCLVDICKLEEQNAFETSPELREALAIVDSLGGQV